MDKLNFLLTLWTGREIQRFETALPLFPVAKDQRAQTLLPALYGELAARKISPVPPEAKRAYDACLYRNTLFYKRGSELKDMLYKKGFNALIIKGLSIEEKFYARPGVRPQNDIDIWVEREKIPGIVPLLLANGFHFLWSSNYHYHFEKEGVGYEIHSAPWSYKYNVFFELPAPPFGPLSSEVYLLLCALQHFDEGGRRLIPFLDAFHIVEKGVDWANWDRLLTSSDAGFLAALFHEYALFHFGASPLPERSLKPLNLSRRSRDKIKSLAEKFGTGQKGYWTAFVAARRRWTKARALLFPPKEVYAHFAGGSRWPWGIHLRRLVKKLSG